MYSILLVGRSLQMDSTAPFSGMDLRYGWRPWMDVLWACGGGGGDGGDDQKDQRTMKTLGRDIVGSLSLSLYLGRRCRSTDSFRRCRSCLIYPAAKRESDFAQSWNWMSELGTPVLKYLYSMMSFIALSQHRCEVNVKETFASTEDSGNYF